MHTKVVLRADRNEYYIRSAKDPEGNWVKRKVITAQGFARLNNWMSVTMISPPTQQIGTQVVGNPYLERDGKSVLRVTARRIGIARTAAGSLTATDLTVTYDLDDYLIGEVWSSWQPSRRSPKPKKWGRVAGDKESASPEATEKLIECPGGVYLVVDLTDSEVLSLWSAHLQRQKFAERNAISICERNILKRYIGTAYANEDGSVNLVHWSQPDRTLKQYEHVAERVARGEAKIEGMEVTIEKDAESISHEEATEALHGDDEAGHAADVEGADTVEEMRSVARNLWREVEPEKRLEILEAMDFETPKAILDCQDRGKMAELVALLEAELS